MKLFHVSPINHPIGTVLQPGKYGSHVKSARTRMTTVDAGFALTILAWEGPLEIYRRLAVPKAPSRLDCLYATSTLAEAQRFRQRYRANADVFEIDVADHVPTHIADFEAISSVPTGKPMIDGFVDGSAAYWTPSVEATLREVLVGGPARVIAKIP
ncbi:hypothetical protein [Bradyrhizobium sp. Arg816]|uniref:hypothetical protein n=1 Tax=Bradyrhizobium sp. Arg816 TaxID=2998491 RepID=UPI00249E1D26|nr:hypothetical protein [Bradyrhizobium sp. Arg816]MDI3565413.1 hypothetical protein [Bradyrhizobium sp. Arg816]